MDRIRQGSFLGICMLLLAGLAAAELMGEQRNSVEQLKAMTDSEFQLTVKAAGNGNAAAQTLLGVAYMQGVRVVKDDTAAVEWFHRAAKKANCIAENNLGLMYFQTGKDRQATEALQQALRLNPELFVPNFFLGLEYVKLKRFDQATDYLKHAARSKPDDVHVLVALGEAYSGVETSVSPFSRM